MALNRNLIIVLENPFSIIATPLRLLLSHLSRVRLCATPKTAAHQVPPSLGFSRQEHWSGLPFPSPTHESEKWKWSRSVVSDSWRPHGLQPIRLLHPWDFPGKSTFCVLLCVYQLAFTLREHRTSSTGASCLPWSLDPTGKTGETFPLSLWVTVLRRVSWLKEDHVFFTGILHS